MKFSKNTELFLIYISKYLGVALIAGSAVHMGTMDHGNLAWYIVLACIGLMLMTTSTIFEAKNNRQKIDVRYVGLVTALSLATGFLSGGIQHYFDNPLYAGMLLAIGVIVAYVTFFLKDGLPLKTRNVFIVFLLSCAIGVLSFTLVNPYAVHIDFAHHDSMSTMHESNHRQNDTHAHHGADMMHMTMSDMVSMLEGKTGKALEKEFITGMIPHHQGAVDMAKRLLQDETISPELRKFAEDIIEAQEREIQMMQQWLNE